ncbi:UDP-N-acetylglucosamine--N-acetylmuramyl-(pentapeptide) pyrophosphoryl-undecaprenol N-acetylglucosamine transferase [Opitutus terrae]|uniref:UDP-N-acetylglucosamine--N-acetylmuramyl-(pentapeptide) pyrophosphoryl-undecaprenol N-acetylglucosamine transferase n=1 Tax=Opitutus terrae (strain DSM 11246 / JCM 15787 / PB90-1) TaxID=452637 RepID=MURG_OPITP|nr:UDP-N-acetylglucosamine--N-acetylmuramyl-(pentapeptide) pyrophosphoryl-undecaprenol N-acetylglucosamine transferase [Opitutus terrae]B1ZU31.1 RecName: Full=UDP-N-acetylglucosamine--N-acetylmuramyl-(pentapeptide) pyrophosphoryl-undecaprenol N-acetylglucosamine transferase; AltName: Full=Undecaprenyl-PP-MurNAc-pentapeptide-UDPGlcNAc GlcNAc transferase [Opitutus terrae PB90-1]ACB75917.1 Undecaprenyldiphospho-muramoylpentapeptide beta-N-acetylglucosaminyltransferase [Opitutus terrae PB90-1]
MSTFLISCGGTGGHLSPGIALAEGLQARGHSVRLLISHKKVDARLIAKYPRLDFTRVPGTGFSLHPVRLARFIGTQSRGLWFCRGLVRAARPAGVVAFGGFTSAGVVLAARWRGVPVALHEANRVPGRAIRVLSRFANRVYLPPGVRLASAPPGAVRPMGLPVRQEIRRVSQTDARARFGFAVGQKLLVVFGGSQGATVLNDWVRREMPALAAEGVQVCCVTGLGKGSDETVELRTHAGQPVRIQFLTFCDCVPELLSAADLVLSRAGAGTIAELVRCETPAILVPFPQAADDHQRANAAFFERQGGGVVVEQTMMHSVRAEVLDVIFDEELLRKFRGNLQRMDRANSLELMLNDLEEMTRTHGASGSPGTATAVVT